MSHADASKTPPTRERIQFPRRRPVAPLASLTDVMGPLTFHRPTPAPEAATSPAHSTQEEA